MFGVEEQYQERVAQHRFRSYEKGHERVRWDRFRVEEKDQDIVRYNWFSIEEYVLGRRIGQVKG